MLGLWKRLYKTSIQLAPVRPGLSDTKKLESGDQESDESFLSANRLFRVPAKLNIKTEIHVDTA